MPKWHQADSMLGNARESKTAKKSQLYSRSRSWAKGTQLKRENGEDTKENCIMG